MVYSTVVLSGGLGERFHSSIPKPLNKINGVAMHEITIKSVQHLNPTIVLNPDIDVSSLCGYNIFILPWVTRSPIESLLIFLRSTPTIINGGILVLDNDVHYKIPPINPNYSALIYIDDVSDSSSYSFINIDDYNVTAIAEKKRISNHAVVGYYFVSKEVAEQYCYQSIHMDYLSDVFSNMLHDHVVKAYLSDSVILGTPEDAKDYTVQRPTIATDNPTHKSIQYLRREGFNIVPYEHVPGAIVISSNAFNINSRNLMNEMGCFNHYNIAPNLIHNKNNNLFVQYSNVVKEGNVDGELYYYMNKPDEFKQYFPKLYSCTNKSLNLERINQPTYFQMLQYGVLTTQEMNRLYAVLDKMHAIPATTITDADIVSFYRKKFHERKSMYPSSELHDRIESMINTYHPKVVGMIHGDCWFSNILRGPKMIDMRGKIDMDDTSNHFTLEGDMHYDYAKILQSILGLDHVVGGIPYNVNQELLQQFIGHLNAKDICYKNILKLTFYTIYCSIFAFDRQEECWKFLKDSMVLYSPS